MRQPRWNEVKRVLFSIRILQLACWKKNKYKRPRFQLEACHVYLSKLSNLHKHWASPSQWIVPIFIWNVYFFRGKWRILIEYSGKVTSLVRMSHIHDSYRLLIAFCIEVYINHVNAFEALDFYFSNCCTFFTFISFAKPFYSYKYCVHFFPLFFDSHPILRDLKCELPLVSYMNCVDDKNFAGDRLLICEY